MQSNVNPNLIRAYDYSNENLPTLKSLSKFKIKNVELEKKVFLTKVYLKYGDKYLFDLSNYDKFRKGKIKIYCPIHGEFEKIPGVFLLSNNKTGCNKCGIKQKNKSKTKSYFNFIEESNKIHNFKYEYPDENIDIYENRKSRITIICKVHGPFQKKGQKHLSGQGCFKCKVEEMVSENILVGGYCEKLFENRPELKSIPAILYYLKINNGEYYKIGITTVSISDRIKGLKCKSMKKAHTFEVVWLINNTLYECFLKEQEILRNYKMFRTFEEWCKELFYTNILPSFDFFYEDRILAL